MDGKSHTWLEKLQFSDFAPVRNDSKQREFVLKEIPEGDTMIQSVEQLRRESERNREQLTKTVDQLRLQITDTAADIQSKVSPQHIKSEVSDFISSKTASWIDSLK
jgi:cell division protein YceG involved in septum cleavage